MADANELPPVPLPFLIGVFAVAIAVGALVMWLGITGRIGAGIP
ncbi:MAG TPA: hypothetical protein VMG99_06290 [Thermoplasmata archaeon]|jgi:hypothetical protein|nr:hypothetical protein [Thermoplasmata archaeon]